RSVIGDLEIFDLEHGIAHRCRPSFGSAISSSVRPTMVNARTTTRIPSPAGTKYHQALRSIAPLAKASSRVLPHEGLRGLPRPRNERVVSERIEIGIQSVALARISPLTLGRM